MGESQVGFLLVGFLVMIAAVMGTVIPLVAVALIDMIFALEGSPFVIAVIAGAILALYMIGRFFVWLIKSLYGGT